MDVTAVKTMVESGHASSAHLAKHFEVTLKEAEDFLAENDIRRPTALDPQYRHISKLASAQRPHQVPWEDLVFDDEAHNFINGINLDETDGRLNAQDIFRYYQGGEPRCFYTGAPADSLLAFDGNPQNYLITNMIPVLPKVAEDRGFEDDLPMMIASKLYEIDNLANTAAGPRKASKVVLGIHLHGRFDPTYGAVLNEPYLDATIEQWVEPYVGWFHPREFLPEHIPATAETLLLWMWRHLSTTAFVKGITRLDVEFDGVRSTLTNDLYLQMVSALMQRAVQSRAISRPSGNGIVVPTQADIASITQRS